MKKVFKIIGLTILGLLGLIIVFILVVNFPSEKVPAPPSPNCTFDSFFIN